ncbi:ATP-binding protein [Candidatus Roizmanbacteria bacterium]|nr:ATP-binding protein [Candidatus Roizmanbacteria bacterium]
MQILGHYFSVSLHLISLIEQRYEKGSLLFTSNESLVRFDKLFGGQKRTGKMIGRIFHHCHTITIQGDSYRIRDKMKVLD